jgi:hypothetical protein
MPAARMRGVFMVGFAISLGSDECGNLWLKKSCGR